MLGTIVMILALCALMTGLYECGVIAIRSKAAVFFAGTIDGRKASFSSCTGKIWRVIRFSHTGEYGFSLSGEIEKGEIELTLRDAAGQERLKLGNGESAVFTAEKGKRCRICIRLAQATGKYEVSWQKLPGEAEK